MGHVALLVPLLLITFLANQVAGSENQRLFSIAVLRVQNLHLLAQKMITDFDDNLLPEQRKQLNNKNFLLDFCNSDSIVSPNDKHETQKSSVLKLLHVSFRLIESWEQPTLNNPTLSGTYSNTLAIRTPLSEKLADLKVGLNLLIKGCQEGPINLDDNDSLQLPPYEDFYQNLGNDGILKKYLLLGCFKKDMHKVETYLKVAKCRTSLEANCTL